MSFNKKFFKALMSKYLRFFSAGLAILLIAECGVLIYIDRVKLAENIKDVNVVKINNNTSSKPSTVKAAYDSDAKDLSASYDGNYVAYTKDGDLYVQSLLTGQPNKISMAAKLTLANFKWVYNSDQLIIAEKSSTSDNAYAKLYNLDVKESYTASEVIDNTGSEPVSFKINLNSDSSKIADMDFSTIVVDNFFKITEKNGSSTVLELNPPNLKKVSLQTKNIGKIQCLKDDAELLYENNDNGKVYAVGNSGSGAFTINGQSQLRLLGFDLDDNVYFAKGKGDKTDTIYYGSVEMDDKDGKFAIVKDPQMKTVSLSESVSVDSIYITIKGDIYYNDSTKGVFKNLQTGSEVSYRGKVKCVYGKGFLTVDNGYMLQNTFDATSADSQPSGSSKTSSDSDSSQPSKSSTDSQKNYSSKTAYSSDTAGSHYGENSKKSGSSSSKSSKGKTSR